MDEGRGRKGKKRHRGKEREKDSSKGQNQKTMLRHKPTTLVGRQTIKSAIMESCYYRTTKCFL